MRLLERRVITRPAGVAGQRVAEGQVAAVARQLVECELLVRHDVDGELVVGEQLEQRQLDGEQLVGELVVGELVERELLERELLECAGVG